MCNLLDPCLGLSTSPQYTPRCEKCKAQDIMATVCKWENNSRIIDSMIVAVPTEHHGPLYNRRRLVASSLSSFAQQQVFNHDLPTSPVTMMLLHASAGRRTFVATQGLGNAHPHPASSGKPSMLEEQIERQCSVMQCFEPHV